jgi:hypothetical protein
MAMCSSEYRSSYQLAKKRKLTLQFLKISSVKAMMHEKLILEAKQGTYTGKTLKITTPTWGTAQDHIIESQIRAKVVVEVNGVPLSAIGRPLGVADRKVAPTFPRTMKLSKGDKNEIELIDK